MPFNTGITEVFASENMLEAVGTRSTTSGQPHGVVYLAEPYPPMGGQLHDLLAFTITTDAPGPPPVPVGPPRVRSAASETIGSLLEQVTVQATEIQLDEAFFLDVDLPPSELVGFAEALSPTVVRLARYPLPVNSREHLSEYRPRTPLGRLQDVYPQRVVGLTSDFGLGESASLQALLQFMVNRWQSEFPWLYFDPIPDLRYPIPSGNYERPGAGVLTLPAIILTQDGDDRLSIRDILDEFLSLIPAAIRSTSRGTIEVIPFYGPDAPSTPELVLAPEDIFEMDRAKPDPSQLYNRARVTARGWDWQEDQPLNEPSFAVKTTFIRSFLNDGDPDPIPSDRVEFPAPDMDVGPNVSYGVQPFINIPGGQSIIVHYSNDMYSAGGSETSPNDLDFLGNTSGQVELFSPDIIGGGQWTPVHVQGSSALITVNSYWMLRWVPEGLEIAMTLEPYNTLGGRRYPANVFSFDVSGEAFVERNMTVVGQFSLANGDQLPGPNGDALVESESLYGPRELNVSTNIFPLDVDQAQLIAQALVLDHIDPKTTRTFEQSWWNAYRVKPDHVGRLIQLPSTEVARVQAWSYRDDFTNHILESTVTAVLTESAVDFDDLLLADSGDFLTFDDGTLVGRS